MQTLSSQPNKVRSEEDDIISYNLTKQSGFKFEGTRRSVSMRSDNSLEYSKTNGSLSGL